MTLAPLVNASPVILGHAVAALAALGLGGLQLALPRGTSLHRMTGWIWASLMMGVALSSLFIHTLPVWGRWSPIHILSLIVILTVPIAVRHARAGRIAAHRRAMLQLFALALIGAGLFTLWPGRIMHAVLFGG